MEGDADGAGIMFRFRNDYFEAFLFNEILCATGEKGRIAGDMQLVVFEPHQPSAPAMQDACLSSKQRNVDSIFEMPMLCFLHLCFDPFGFAQRKFQRGFYRCVARLGDTDAALPRIMTEDEFARARMFFYN